MCVMGNLERLELSIGYITEINFSDKNYPIETLFELVEKIKEDKKITHFNIVGGRYTNEIGFYNIKMETSEDYRKRIKKMKQMEIEQKEKDFKERETKERKLYETLKKKYEPNI